MTRNADHAEAYRNAYRAAMIDAADLTDADLKAGIRLARKVLGTSIDARAMLDAYRNTLATR